MDVCAQRSKGRTPVARLAERDRHVLSVAERLFLEQGYHQVSLALVARSAGVATRTIYARFGEKRALLEAILDCRRAAAGQALITLAGQRHPPGQALHRLAEHAFEHSLSGNLELLYGDLLAERSGSLPSRHCWAIEGPWRVLLEGVLPSTSGCLADVFVACLMREQLHAPALRSCEDQSVYSIDAMAQRAVARFLEKITYVGGPPC